MHNGPFRRCHEKMLILVLFIKTKIPVKFQENLLQTLGNMRAQICQYGCFYKEMYAWGHA